MSGAFAQGFIDTYQVDAAPATPVGGDRHIDVAPSANVTFGGWAALSLAPPVLATDVEVFVDGKRFPARFLATPRPDVVSVTRQPGLLRSGYTITLSTASLGEGTHLVQLVAVAPGARGLIGAPISLVVR